MDMNRRKIFLFLLLTVLCVNSNAQKVKIAVYDIRVSDQLLQRLSDTEKSTLNYFNNALRVNLESSNQNFIIFTTSPFFINNKSLYIYMNVNKFNC